MRKSTMAMVSLLFVVAPLHAQQHNRSNVVTVFVSDASFSSNSSGDKFGADFGLALSHMFNDRFSAELAVTSQHAESVVTFLGPTGAPSVNTYSDRLYPIDANVSYHFLTNSRWKPYLGAGARYVSDTLHYTGPFANQRFTENRLDPEVSGGITFQFNPALGLRFDAKQIIGDRRVYVADPNLKVSVGLSLRF
jgi:outer membrane protein W